MKKNKMELPQKTLHKEKSCEYLKCNFTKEEKEEFSQQLVRKIADLESTELRKRETVKSIDADIAALETGIKNLARSLYRTKPYRHKK